MENTMLPKLKGTKLQITSATRIRKQKLRQIHSLSEKIKPVTDADGRLLEIMGFITGIFETMEVADFFITISKINFDEDMAKFLSFIIPAVSAIKENLYIRK